MATAAVATSYEAIEPQTNGPRADDVLPGTTVPKQELLHPCKAEAASNGTPEPLAFPGPTIDGRETTTTLYEPDQVAAYSDLDGLLRVINKAFRHSGIRDKVMPTDNERLRDTTQYLQQIGRGPGTFVYIVTWADTGEPIATAAAHRYTDEILVAELDPKKGMTFIRTQLPEGAKEGDDMWELKIMAVEPGLMRKGLAGYLMKLVDEEVRRRFKATVVADSKDGETKSRKLVMALTTLKESNADFYRRRGYRDDYETSHPRGHMGSPNGFGVVHMSKVLER